MAVESINTNYNSLNNIVRETNNTLGKDAFLKILVTQLKNQDPLNPVEDTEFIAQMAQFSSLEELTNINASVDLSRAFSLVGKHVYASFEANGVKKLVSGIVEKVSIINGQAYATVDSIQVRISDIVEVINKESLIDGEVI